MAMLLQTVIVAETDLAEGLTIKLWRIVKLEKSDWPSEYAYSNSIQNWWKTNNNNMRV